MTERVLVAATCAPYKQTPDRDPMEWRAWLAHAEQWADDGHEFFLADELQPGDSEGYPPLEFMLAELGWPTWNFAIDTNARQLTSEERLVRICTGRNLIHEYAANRNHFDRVLFLDTDIEPPPDCIDRLLEVDHPLVGFHVPTYCLDGPKIAHRLRNDMHSVNWGEGWVPDYTHKIPKGDLRVHWNTAGALMVKIEAVCKLRWRWDLAAGQTDDPCFAADALALGFGLTIVRHDVIGKHHPEVIGPVETRGHDLYLEAL